MDSAHLSPEQSRVLRSEDLYSSPGPSDSRVEVFVLECVPVAQIRAQEHQAGWFLEGEQGRVLLVGRQLFVELQQDQVDEVGWGG